MLESLRIGFCMWDVPAMILIGAAVALLLFQHKRDKDETKEIQQQLGISEESAK